MDPFSSRPHARRDRSPLARVLGAATLASVGLLGRPAFADPSPCASLTAHRDDTVITFATPSTFSVCREGRAQSGVVAGRPIFLEILPVAGARMFEFRIHGRSAEPKPSGLTLWAAQARRATGSLNDLEHSSEAVAQIALLPAR